MSFVVAGVSNVRRAEAFKALVTNFDSTPLTFCPGQAVAKDSAATGKLLKSHISQEEKLSIIPETLTEGKFQNCHVDTRSIDTTNKHLADKHQSHMSSGRKQTNKEGIKIDVMHNIAIEARDTKA